MPYPNVLFAAEGSAIDPPFVKMDDYYECFERAQDKQDFEVLGDGDSGPFHKVAISQKAVAKTKVYPPADLAAMVVEGVYVGWKSFFDALDQSYTNLELKEVHHYNNVIFESQEVNKAVYDGIKQLCDKKYQLLIKAHTQIIVTGISLRPRHVNL
ncbi:hypothetical protein SELMODRAFT_415758 [Selaginella moellendorffii]|uniref:Uncharacterized protein n=1 Tax=Selaginella moellendorffii TaxID=88036 RepID=D8RX54_SELML|nr:hypothetical protein SELMODRAFT_415758 [Selaginella moellendorffii]